MNNSVRLTLPTMKDIFGTDDYDTGQLRAIAKYGAVSNVTDLALLSGADPYRYNGNIYEGAYFTKSQESVDMGYLLIYEGGWCGINRNSYTRDKCIRPVIDMPSNYIELCKNSRFNDKDVREVDFGEYPQNAPPKDIQEMLEEKYRKGEFKLTGASYTFNRFDNIKAIDNSPFEPVKYNEYEYNGKKYIRTTVESNYIVLNNGECLHDAKGSYVWIEVSPVTWLIDTEEHKLISKYCLLSGIRFDKEDLYDGDFSKTEMYDYLKKYMSREMMQGAIKTYVSSKPKTVNSYGFNFEKVSEEDIIRGSVESGIAVFLHGPSSEGKSARVKQIDPDCEIIYLRNATPDSLNGKSVYNAETGEMIDVPPTWLKKLKEKCEREPDKLHILFFDEITNALPSIQGIAFNIVLDREVNGIWKLPDNARIVAAGNDMKDSLAANELAEPLFNRFAHVYIKTTTESWLKWASENNIHPAIYAYIAYTRGEALRSKYDGEKPNADPRKWEMASKMLYKTNNPEMLRALIGEDLTEEFIHFCKCSVITLDDVINDNYSESDLTILNTAERYSTIMGLSGVDEENFGKVRDFVCKLGPEFVSTFDSLWCRNDEHRLEIVAEYRLTENKGVGRR